MLETDLDGLYQHMDQQTIRLQETIRSSQQHLTLTDDYTHQPPLPHVLGEYVRAPAAYTHAEAAGLVEERHVAHLGADATASQVAVAAQQQQQQQQQQQVVDVTMKLGLDFAAAGAPYSSQRQAFEYNLTCDLVNSTGAWAGAFHIISVSPGSVIIDLEIHPDPAGRGPSPLSVANDLEIQATDPSSPLRHGTITCYTQALALPSLRPGTMLTASAAPADARVRRPLALCLMPPAAAAAGCLRRRPLVPCLLRRRPLVPYA